MIYFYFGYSIDEKRKHVDLQIFALDIHGHDLDWSYNYKSCRQAYLYFDILPHIAMLDENGTFQGSRKRLIAENQIPLICSEIPEFSWVVMDFCGCKTALLKKCGCSCTNCTHPYATPRLDLTRLTLPHYFVAKIVLIMSFFVD